MIDTSMFEYHRDTWPAKELAWTETGAPQAMRRALREAEAVLSEFKAVQIEVMGDAKLSAVGKKEAQNRWAAQKVPALAGHLDVIRETVAATEATLIGRMTEKLLDGDDKNGPEIRSWLHDKPNETDRSDAIRQLVRQGDYSALKAVLAVPAYLTGIDPQTLGDLRDDALKQIEPDRFAKLEAIRKGRDVAEKAVAAAIRAVEAELARAIPEPSQPRQPERPKAEPIDPETARRIYEASEAALAKQEQMRAAEAAKAA